MFNYRKRFNDNRKTEFAHLQIIVSHQLESYPCVPSVACSAMQTSGLFTTAKPVFCSSMFSLQYQPFHYSSHLYKTTAQTVFYISSRWGLKTGCTGALLKSLVRFIMCLSVDTTSKALLVP